MKRVIKSNTPHILLKPNQTTCDINEYVGIRHYEPKQYDNNLHIIT